MFKKKNKNNEKDVKKTVTVNDESANDVTSNSVFESSLDTSFFYTSDKFLNTFDDKDIFKTITDKYDGMRVNNDDTLIKKTIISFLNDENFIEEIILFYNITIYDIFKLMYAQYLSLFKGQYLKKLLSEIKNKLYAKPKRRKKDY